MTTAEAAAPKEGHDFVTFHLRHNVTASGWAWCCQHCPQGHGWHRMRTRAREIARTHVIEVHGPGSD